MDWGGSSLQPGKELRYVILMLKSSCVAVHVILTHMHGWGIRRHATWVFHAKEGREVPRTTLLLHHFDVGIYLRVLQIK